MMNKQCFLFHGDDHFSIKDKTAQVFLEYDVPEDAIEVYDYEEVGLHIALSNALTLPFLVDKKGVVIRNASFLKRQGKVTEEELDDLMRFCQMSVKETILVIQAPYEKIDGQKKIVKYLKKNIVTKSFKTNKQFNVYDYVKDQLREKQIHIESYALTQFVNRINHDLDSIHNELDKLISFANDKGTITVEMIEQITIKDIDDNIFNLVNALVDKNKAKLIEIYEELKTINVSEIWMLSTISNKLLEILHTKALIKMGYNQKDIMTYFKVSNGRAYYMKKNADATDEDLLEFYIEKISTLDFEIKSGKIDKGLGMELFLLNT